MVAAEAEQRVSQYEMLQQRGAAAHKSVTEAFEAHTKAYERVKQVHEQLTTAIDQYVSTESQGRRAQEEVKRGLTEQSRELRRDVDRISAACRRISDSQAEGQQAVILSDADTWQRRLELMGVRLSRKWMQSFDEHAPLVKQLMASVGQAPNNNQYAIAAHAASLVSKRTKTRQLYSVPPGMGKSRVASTLMYLCTLMDGITKVCYYYSHPRLQNVDEEALEKLRTILLGVDVTTECVDDKKTTIAAANDTLVILDEADDIIVDKQTKIVAQNVVGLTATAVDDAILGHYFKKAGWALTDSKIDCDLEYYYIESLEAFLQATRGLPRLVFGDE